MIEDLGYTGHRLGYYAGGLAAAFCGAQFTSSVLWGLISDTYGRKVAIVVGTFGTAIGMYVFGTAKTYTQAIMGRILGGFLCGNLGVMKCFLTEITDDSNRGKGFAWLSVSWATGTLIAPLLGGLLCNPAEKFPHIFNPHSRSAFIRVFVTYPYLLPCLIAVVVNIVTAVLCMIFMKESRRALLQRDSPSSSPSSSSKGGKGGVKDRESGSSKGIELTAMVSKDTGGKYTQVIGDDEGTQVVQNPFVIGSEEDDEEDEQYRHSLSKQSNRGKTIGKMQRVAVVSDESSHGMLGTPMEQLDDEEGLGDGADQLGCMEEGESSADIDEGVDGEEDCLSLVKAGNCCYSPSTDVTNSKGSKVQYCDNNSAKSVLRQRIVILATGSYGMLAMSYILLDETIPLFLKLSREEGGFEFTSSQIGLLLSLCGAAMLLFSSFVMPIIASKSKKWLYEVGIIGGIPCVFLWPCLAVVNKIFLIHFNNHHLYLMTLWPLLLLTAIAKNVFASCSFTAVMIQVNHSVYEDYLGAVNGLGQSLAALARAIGPAFGGFLWSVSIKSKFVFLNFIGVSMLLVICFFVNRQLPDAIDFKKKDRRRGEMDGVDDSNDGGDKGGMAMMH